MSISNRGISIAIVAGVVAAAIGVGIAAERDEAPDAVRKAVAKACPGGRVTEVEMEQPDLRCYDVEVQDGERERDVLVTADGVVVEIEEEVDAASLPAAVKATLQQMGGEVAEVEKVEVRADVRVVPLDLSRTEYEAEIVIDGRAHEVRIAADGKVIRKDPADDDDDDDGDADDDDDDDEGDEDEDEDDPDQD